MVADLKRTPLFDEHLRLGAKCAPFGGWEMPIRYAGILAEHKAVRQGVGIFDISHMAQAVVHGSDAGKHLDALLTNRIADLAPGHAQYTLLCNECGGIIDDLIVYRLPTDTAPGGGDEAFLLVLNASMADTDLQWLHRWLDKVTGVRLEDRRSSHAAIAVQGPGAPAILERLGFPRVDRNRTAAHRFPGGYGAIAGTGYTGEPGCELFLHNADAARVWNAFLDAGAAPCGLGARDVLRLEMAFPLNGADLNPGRTPLEAGLGAFVDLGKGPFIGREPLVQQKAAGLAERLTAVEAVPGAPPLRAHYPVWHEDAVVGELTSGTMSPALGRGIGLGYLPRSLAKPGIPVEIEIRGRKHAAGVVRKPFYKSGT